MASAKKYKLVGCSVLQEEVASIAGELGVDLEAEWIELGLHDNVEKLRAEVNAAVGRCRGRKDLDAILLLYGLCSNGLVGVQAPGIPLVIPRVHDCISLFLGSAARYHDEHDKTPGTYWFSRAFLHRRDDKGAELLGIGSGEGANAGAKREQVYKEYVEKYGEENARFLMEALVDSWKRNYTRAVFLAADSPDADADRERVRRLASENGWQYQEMQLDLRMVRMLISGDWPEHEFLVVPPNASIVATNDARVLACGLTRSQCSRESPASGR